MKLLNKLVISVFLIMLLYQLTIEVKYFILNGINELSIIITKLKIKRELARRNKAIKTLAKLERELKQC